MDSTIPVFFTKEVSKQLWLEAQQVERSPPAANDKCCCTFYRVTRPFIFALRLLGCFPYTAHRDVIQGCSLCSWWSLYSLIAIIFQNALLFMTTQHVYFSNEDPFDAKLFDIINIFVLIYQAFGPITFWFEVPAIIRYYAKWQTYENELRLCNISLDGQLKKWVIYIILPMLPYVFIASYYQALIHGSLIHMPALVFLHIHSAFHLSVWIISGFFLHSTAFRIIRRIKKVAEDRDPVEIAACRRAWLTLSELTADLGNAFGPTLMELLLFSSIVLIANCYFIMFFFRTMYQADAEEQSIDFSARIFFIFLSSVSITMLCELGQRCTNAVGSVLLQELLRLNASPQEKHLHREVNMFIQSVWLRYPDMVLCGFLTLNRRLLVSLVSGGVTYLIVLVQFRSSDHSN